LKSKKKKDLKHRKLMLSWKNLKTTTRNLNLLARLLGHR